MNSFDMRMHVFTHFLTHWSKMRTSVSLPINNVFHVVY